MSYIAAQLSSQVSLVKYFGGNGKIDAANEAEIARYIIQSQVNVYKAIELAVAEVQEMDNMQLLEDLKWVYERKEITEGLEDFVMSAYRDGAISAKEAESILHPLHHQISSCLSVLNECTDGIIRTNQKSTSDVAIGSA